MIFTDKDVVSDRSKHHPLDSFKLISISGGLSKSYDLSVILYGVNQTRANRPELNFWDTITTGVPVGQITGVQLPRFDSPAR